MRYLGYMLLVVFFVLSCDSADVTLIDPSKKYAPTESVNLLFEEPTKPYEVIAIIEGVGSQYDNESEVIKAIRKEARKIGAHTIIPLNTEKEYIPTSTHANPVAGSAPITIAVVKIE